MWIAIGIMGWLLMGLLGRCILKHWWVNHFGDTRGLAPWPFILAGLCYLTGVVCFVATETNNTFLNGKKFNRWGLKL